MKLFYAPAARATHLHPMSDLYIYQRQYRVGRMLVTYALLHPYLMDRKQRETIRWLEAFQHVLRHDQNAPAPSALRAGEGEEWWLSDFMEPLVKLDAVDREAVAAPGWAARNVGELVDSFAALKSQVFELRIERARLDGMADEWFGVDPGTPNPARNFLRSLMYAEMLKRDVLSPLYDSHWAGRYSYIERLRSKRPIAASLLRTIVRLATSVAKRAG